MFCGKCGSKLRASDDFCTGCEKQVKETELSFEQSEMSQNVDDKIDAKEENLESNKSGKRTKSIVVAIVSIVILALIVSIIQSRNQSQLVAPSDTVEGGTHEANYESPFDLSVWGETSILQVGIGSSAIDAPIPFWAEVIDTGVGIQWFKDFGAGYENVTISVEDVAEPYLTNLRAFMEELIDDAAGEKQLAFNIELDFVDIHEKDGKVLSRTYWSYDGGLYQYVQYVLFFEWMGAMVQVFAVSDYEFTNPRVSEEILKAYGIIRFYEEGLLQEESTGIDWDNIDDMSEYPFDIDVWGKENVIPIASDDTELFVPIPRNAEIVYAYEDRVGWKKDFGEGNVRVTVTIGEPVIEINREIAEEAVLGLIDLNRSALGVESTGHSIIEQEGGILMVYHWERSDEELVHIQYYLIRFYGDVVVLVNISSPHVPANPQVAEEVLEAYRIKGFL